MLIGIGFKNPVKIAATEEVIKQIWPDAKVISFNAPSNVDDQPRSDDEAIEGARNRASYIIDNDPDIELAIGQESAVVEFNGKLFATGWAVVIDRNGKEGIGSGGRFELPEKVSQKIKKGMEMGPAFDHLTGDHNIKQKHGAVGHLTKGIITRTTAVQREITYALIPFISREHY